MPDYFAEVFISSYVKWNYVVHSGELWGSCNSDVHYWKGSIEWGKSWRNYVKRKTVLTNMENHVDVITSQLNLHRNFFQILYVLIIQSKHARSYGFTTSLLLVFISPNVNELFGRASLKGRKSEVRVNVIFEIRSKLARRFCSGRIKPWTPWNFWMAGTLAHLYQKRLLTNYAHSTEGTLITA